MYFWVPHILGGLLFHECVQSYISICFIFWPFEDVTSCGELMYHFLVVVLSIKVFLLEKEQKHFYLKWLVNEKSSSPTDRHYLKLSRGIHRFLIYDQQTAGNRDFCIPWVIPSDGCPVVVLDKWWLSVSWAFHLDWHCLTFELCVMSS